jgi:osmotically-inducible protein OsmY
MRVSRRLAFEAPQLPAPVMAMNLQSQFLTLQSSLPGISVQAAEPGHVVLQGTVATEDARRLAEAVARLEPGVRTITNQITVPNAAPAGPQLGP